MGQQVHWLPVNMVDGAERLVVHGDFVARGDVLIRFMGLEILAPVDGVFVGSGKRGPFAVIEGLVEERGQDGSPVGRSFEVRAADSSIAMEGARIKASQAGVAVGRVLHWEQIEAGTWEVVLVSLVEAEEADRG